MHIEKLIEIHNPNDDRSPARAQYEEWVARFCYAAAQLPPTTVAHFIDLMETCAESNTLEPGQQRGTA